MLFNHTISFLMYRMNLLCSIKFLRASKLLNELKSVEYEKLRNGREWPQIRAGDAIEVKVSLLSTLGYS